MNIKVLTKLSKEITDFEIKEWDEIDKKYYGHIQDWNPKSFVIVAYENDEIVGSVNFNIKAGVAEIETVVVKESYRRKKIGIAMLKEVERIAKENKAHKLYLTTGKHWNVEEFYRKFGMTQTGIMPNHYINKEYIEYSKFI